MQKKSKIFLMLLILILSSAVSYAETKGMGQITAYKGDVAVRTNGRWIKLDKVPHILFTSDKVVTFRGRAQIRFFDGDTIILDVDSNISMNQDEEIDDRPVLRQINILLGRVQFDIMPKKEEKHLQFRTPTITAGIRGTSGEIKVNLDGTSEGGLFEGDWDIEGLLKANEPITIDMENSLPLSDPESAGSDFQKDVNNAFQRRMAAIVALANAKTRLKNTKKGDMQGAALAAASVAEAASTLANADIASYREVLTEAGRFGDNELMRKTEEILNQMLIVADNASELAQIANRMADTALDSNTPEAAQAAIYTALAAGSAAEASAAATTAGVNVVEIAVCDRDPMRMSGAEKEMNKALSRAKKAAKATQDALNNAQNAESFAVLSQKHKEAAIAGAKVAQALSMKNPEAESNARAVLLQKEKEAEKDVEEAASGKFFIRPHKGKPIKSLEDEWSSPGINDEKVASPM